MSGILRRLITIFALTPLAMTGAGASTNHDAQAENAWLKAVRQDTLVGYAEFALRYPGATQAAEAHARLRHTSGLTDVPEFTGLSEDWPDRPGAAPDLPPDPFRMAY